MTPILTLPKRWQNLDVFKQKKNAIKSYVHVMLLIVSNIRAPVLLNLLNLLQKSDKMLSKPRILSLFLNSFDKFNKTWPLV